MIYAGCHLYAQSRYQDKLWSPLPRQTPAAYFEHRFDGYALEARILYNRRGEPPWVLSVHGARADFSKADATSLGLQQRGVSLLGMTLSGHSGASPLPPHETSLAQNVAEARAFYGYLDAARPRVLIGYSLGAVPALKILEERIAEVEALVLVGPALYSAKAYGERYGEGFRAAIREPFSYRDTDVLDTLRRFEGRLLLVRGEFDGLDPALCGKPPGTAAGEVAIGRRRVYSPIPPEVFALIAGSVPPARRDVLVVPDCDHSVALWALKNAAAAEPVVERIAAFVLGRGAGAG